MVLQYLKIQRHIFFFKKVKTTLRKCVKMKKLFFDFSKKREKVNSINFISVEVKLAYKCTWYTSISSNQLQRVETSIKLILFSFERFLNIYIY